jgi:hypothetical protein
LTDSASTPRLRATFAIYLGWWRPVRSSARMRCPARPTTFPGCWVSCAFALACLGRIWTSVFIAGHKDVELVTTGPYARCRHPLYACSVLGALGLGLTTRSVLLCVIVVVLIAALVIYAGRLRGAVPRRLLPRSVPGLRRRHPNKWWPRAGAQILPDHLDVHPVIFWKAFLDAGSFFLLYLLVALCTAYRLSF